MTQRDRNFLEEEMIVEEALKEIKSGKFLNRPIKSNRGPDFMVDWQFYNKKQKLWIEVTTIPYTDNKTENKFNNPADDISDEITQELQSRFESSELNLVHLTIRLDKIPKLKNKKHFKEKILQIVDKNIFKDGYIRLSRGNCLELPGEIDYLEIRISRLEKYSKLFSVYSVKKFLKHDSLQERILEKIKSKEEKAIKSYLPVTKKDKLWLIIRIDDGTISEFDLDKIKFDYKNKYFSRIYVQLNFQPKTGNYPLKRII